MNAKLIFGLVLAGSAAVFIIQNTAVMELKFLFWKTSISSALIIFFMLAVGGFLGWLLHGSFNRRKGVAHKKK